METLREILLEATDDDLMVLAEYQKEKEKYNSFLTKWEKVSFLINEVELNGGNTFANMIRGRKGINYDEIVQDVAKHFKVNFNSKNPPATDILEFEIVKKLVTDEFEKMTTEQQNEMLENLGASRVDILNAVPPMLLAGLLAAKLSGFAIYKLTTITANAIAKQMLGRGLTFAATGGLMRGVSVLIGPLGWAISGAWLAFDLAGPAFRKTVPSVIHIAMLRQKYRANKQPKCSKCETPIMQGDKFCSECGAQI